MRVAIITNGSRGDVQPYLAIARGLLDRGHTVTFATLHHHRGLVERHPVPFRPLQQEPFFRIVKEFRAGLFRSPLAIWRGVRDEFEAAFDEWLQAAEGADLLIAHPLIATAPDIAEAKAIPLVVASTIPVLCPTVEFPQTLVAGVSRGGTFNRLTYTAAAVATVPVDAVRRQWRRSRLGLRSPIVPLTGGPGAAIHHVHGYSPHLLSRPRDWPAWYSVDGFWRLPDGAEEPLPADLQQFIANGPAPVYVGFGSMVMCPPEHTSSIIDAILARGCRAIIDRCSGAMKMDVARRYDPAQIFALERPGGVSHELLFRRASVIVHHAGPGTVGTALRAGKPQICCPFRYDQPFWSQRLMRMGVAPAPLPMSRMSTDEFRRRLDDVLSDGRYRDVAQRLQPLLQQENGVETTVRRLEQIHAERPRLAA